MSTALRIIFAGTPEFAAEHLSALIASEHQVVAVYSQPDRPAGRGRKLAPTAVKQVALDHNIPVHQPLSLKAADEQQILADYQADIMVVVAYGLILPKAVLDTPKLGCINVHASILPRWRGAAPIQRAIEAGDESVGVTIMQMDVGLDTGDMINVVAKPNDGTITGSQLHDQLIELGKPALLATLTQLAAGSAKPIKQDESLVTYAHKMSKEEALLDFSQPAKAIIRKIKAFNSWPVCFTTLNNDNMRIWNAEWLDDSSTHSPGDIVFASNKALHVQCGDGVIALTEVQLPGAKAMPINALMAGKSQLFIDAGKLGN